MSAIADLSTFILCGGLGTRLREETEYKPKPMVAIGDRPILWHIMKHYRHYGVGDFALCLGYRGDVIRDYFLNYRRYNSDFAINFGTGDVTTLSNGFAEDWRVSLIETGADSLTGTRIRNALRYSRANRFLATYGDGVSNVDLNKLLRYHESAGKLATVTAVRPSSRFGELSIQGGLADRFREKPQVTEGWINGGFFVFEAKAFDRIGPDDNVSLEEAVLETLAAEGELAVYEHHGFWQSMDTYREMQLLNEMWSSGTAPWHLWEKCKLSA